jgi:glycosyltransferase involved in cell wall biosynthesis
MAWSDPECWGRLHIVHCGVIPELYTGNPPGPKTQGNALVFIGRLAPVKGLRKLIGAFELALQSNPDLSLTIVGDGPARGWLEQATKKFGSAVTLTGPRSQGEVADILAQSDVLVLPSFAEGVPVVLMEAMASGKPVIATQVAGVPELVEDGVSGYVVPPGDKLTLAARIVALTDDPDLQKRFGLMGQKKVQAEFDIRQEAARIGDLFGD